MSGYIKYFEKGGKKMSFVIQDDNVLDKYNDIKKQDGTRLKIH